MDYKKYSLENLENWLHDAMSAGEATPEEIYNTIKKVIEEQYYHHKHYTGQAYELLALLNGNGIGHIKGYDDCVDRILSCDKDDLSPECKSAWKDFWEQNYYPEEYALREAEYYQKEDKVVKWQLPVYVDEITGDCYINLPDDLLEVADLKEGDTVEWVDNGNGSYTVRKVNGTK
jgi:hypothetical protein